MKGKIKIKGFVAQQSLLQENNILKKENELLRNQILQLKTKLYETKEENTEDGNEDEQKIDLSLEIIELQRNRINDLQAEIAELTQKNDMLIIEKTSSPRNTNSSNIQTELMQEKRKNSILEEQLKELSIKYAKEFALLKTKLTEQNAELIINHENNFPFFAKSPNMFKLGAKKKLVIRTLAPIDHESKKVQKTSQNF